MHQRHFEQLRKELAENGLTLGDTVNEDGSLNVSLKNFQPHHRRMLAIDSEGNETNAVIAALENLGTVRVDLQPQDLEKLNGAPSAMTLAVGRGIESGMENITRVTSSLKPEELYTSVDAAQDAVLKDTVESDELRELLHAAAEEDMIKAGLIEPGHTSMDAYDAALKAKYSTPDLPPERSGEFADNAPRPYKSPFAEEF